MTSNARRIQILAPVIGLIVGLTSFAPLAVAGQLVTFFRGQSLVVQSAENAHRISFPGHHRPVETKERAYIKGTFFRYGSEDLEVEEEEEEAGEEPELAADAVAEDELPEEPLPVEPDEDGEEDEEGE